MFSFEILLHDVLVQELLLQKLKRDLALGKLSLLLAVVVRYSLKDLCPSLYLYSLFL
jgi:hypothetical protein